VSLNITKKRDVGDRRKEDECMKERKERIKAEMNDDRTDRRKVLDRIRGNNTMR
jgi:hypothetical protein